MNIERVNFVKQIIKGGLNDNEQLLLIIELIGETTPDFYSIIDDTLPFKHWAELREKLK